VFWSGEGGKRPPIEIPAYGIFALLVINLVLRYVIPTPVEGHGWERLSLEIRTLTMAVQDLSELEERRMLRTELTYRPEEWREIVRKLDEIHRRRH
jgi:hypothetical protein